MDQVVLDQVTDRTSRSPIGAALGRLGLILALVLTTGLVPTSDLDAADFSQSPGDEFCRVNPDARIELRSALRVARSRRTTATPPAAPATIAVGPRVPGPVSPPGEHRGPLRRRSRSPGWPAPRAR